MLPRVSSSLEEWFECEVYYRTCFILNQSDRFIVMICFGTLPHHLLHAALRSATQNLGFSFREDVYYCEETP